MRKELGKIKSVFFGVVDFQLGLHFDFSINGGVSGVLWRDCFLDYETVKNSDFSDWTDKERDEECINLLKRFSKYLKEAKVDKIENLKNIPVELTFENNTLRSWRILTEVL